MILMWFLSQFYTDPLHSANLGCDLPVCSAYGLNYHAVQVPPTPDAWGLVTMWTSIQQIEAARQDPRVIVCGKDYDPPPAKVLEVFGSQLDPGVTYLFMGQVIARLAQSDMSYYHQPE